jgi:hypothetical protein
MVRQEAEKEQKKALKKGRKSRTPEEILNAAKAIKLNKICAEEEPDSEKNTDGFESEEFDVDSDDLVGQTDTQDTRTKNATKSIKKGVLNSLKGQEPNASESDNSESDATSSESESDSSYEDDERTSGAGKSKRLHVSKSNLPKQEVYSFGIDDDNDELFTMKKGVTVSSSDEDEAETAKVSYLINQN